MELDELLLRGELGLQPVVPGRRRPVLGAHVVEIPHPTRWVPPGWVLLTTGLRLTGPRDCRELVAELSAGGVAALGFGTGVVHDGVPEALVDEAAHQDLPLFAVPEATPFREIVRAVDAVVLDRDLDAFRRSAAITDSLTGLLGGPAPQQALVQGLARVLHCGVSLHRPDGAVLDADPGSGAAGARERWDRFRGLAVTAPPVEVVDADGLFAAAVRPGGRPRAWLVVGVSRGSVPVPLIVRAVALVARLLAGIAAAADEDATRRRQERAEALRRLVAGQEVAGGPPADRPRTLLVLAGTADLVEVERVLDDLRRPYLLGELDGALVAMVGEDVTPGGLPVAGIAEVTAGAAPGPRTGTPGWRPPARRSPAAGRCGSPSWARWTGWCWRWARSGSPS